MNFGGDGDLANSGERAVLRSLLGGEASPVVLDVGANRGLYSAAVLASNDTALVHAFEPSEAIFEQLLRTFSGTDRVRCWPLALSDTSGLAQLSWPEGHDGLASLSRRNLNGVGLEIDRIEEVQTETLDAWSRRERVDSISLLKIDVEGNELAVLRGAQELLAREAIDSIQFEFGGTDIDSRTFLRDFFDLLGDRYAVHRLLPSGLGPVIHYSERHEIFVFHNYVAMKT